VWVVADSKHFLTSADTSTHLEQFKSLLNSKIKVIPAETLESVIDFSIHEIAFKYELVVDRMLL
jgi:hypothetical protein